MSTLTLGTVADWLRLFRSPGEVTELRALAVSPDGRYPHTEAGFFDHDHLDVMAKEASRLSKISKGVYFSLNPLQPEILSRSCNRIQKADSGSLAADKHVVARKWLLIDADPVRPVEGIPSTEEEKADALALIEQVRLELCHEHGWPEGILADSGNGYHGLYRIDLPADDGGLVERCLKALAKRYDTARVKIDQKVFNPARICKLYGTVARKGDSTPERPHRQSCIIEAPECAIVPVELLQQMAAEVQPAKPLNGHANGFHGNGHAANGHDHLAKAWRYIDKMPRSISGQAGHKAAFAVARKLVKRFELGDAPALDLMSRWNEGCQPPWLEHELRHKIESARAKAKDDPPRPASYQEVPPEPPGAAPENASVETEEPDPAPAEIHLTDRGNALRVVHRHGADLRYCGPMKKWFVWDSRRWLEDDLLAAIWRIKETQASLFKWVGDRIKELGQDEEEEDDERKSKRAGLKKFLNHCLKWEAQKAINSCLESMRSELGVPILPTDFDVSAFLCNVQNGTIELQTGKLREHQREDMLTKICPVDFDPLAQCPLWLACLGKWMGGNRKLVDYLQRVAGYSLTADTSEQCLWFFYGTGANGKSTFLNTILAVLGDYGHQAVSELLLQKSMETHPTERADLRGKRFVATIETDEGRRLAESFVKQLTGGEVVQGRKMRQDFVAMKPTWKIFLAANHKPRIKGDDTGIWRRVKLVPWTVTIAEADKDPKLVDKLKAEWPGILAWAVRGCLEWQRNGLQEPAEVTQATKDYRNEQDLLAEFITERCLVNDTLSVRSSVLLEAFEKYCGEDITRNSFAKRMEAKGYLSEPDNDNCKVYKRLGLKS